MAQIRIDDTTVTIVLSVAEKVEAVHGDLTFPRSAVVTVRTIPDAMAEVHGLRAPGTGIPGLLLAGTWRGPGGTVFALCHGSGPGVVIQLTGAAYDQVVMTVDDPAEAVRGLS
ncbi:MAG: hypothetical protein ACYCU5_10095 [Actinomycetes bacterium]